MIYLNYNSTAPLCEAAKKAMSLQLAAGEGNPAEQYLPQGRAASAVVEHARQQVAGLVGCCAEEVVFTSGGSEACFLAMAGALAASGLRRILLSSIEHPAVAQAAKWLEANMKVEVDVLPISYRKEINWSDCQAKLLKSPALFCLMSANNETGDILPVEQAATLAKQHNCLLFSDAVQLIAKKPFDFSMSGVDLLSLSAHKISGPRGVGALIIKKGTPFSSPLVAGGQEAGRRGGTQAVAAIAGFGAAAEAAQELCRSSLEQVAASRNLFEEIVLSQYPGAEINRISSGLRLANTSNIHLPGIVSFRLVEALAKRELYISAGSACSSAQLQPSKTLLALGMTTLRALSSIRVSFGYSSSEAEARLAAQMVVEEALQQRNECEEELKRIQAKGA